MVDEAADPTEAQRELAARRRDLEREFDGKMRDLKAQHQRRHDNLKREQAEWEAHRREQAKALADRTETVRRRADNAQQRVESGAAAKQELQALRQQVKDLEQAQREAKRTQARLEAAAEEAGKRLRSTQGRSRWAAGVLGLGAFAWLVAGWREPLGLGFLAAAVALAVLLLLAVGRRKAERAGDH
jgi:chromosome segregation ATPase